MTAPTRAPSPDSLRREAEVFTRYLVARGPTEYVANKYRDGHQFIPYLHERGVQPVDGFLARVARRGRTAVRVADSYARIFRRNGPLRQKLTLLAAILESSPEYHTLFQASEPITRSLVWVRLGRMGFGFAARLGIGLLVFGPVHLAGMLTVSGERRFEPARSDG